MNTSLPKQTLFIYTLVTACLFLALSSCGPKPPNIPLLDAIGKTQDISVVQEHMEFGTDPNKTFIPIGFPYFGASALHLAVLIDNQEIVDILLDYGADIDIKARETYQGSPLDWAAFFGIKNMVVHLAEKGADLNSRTIIGSTPLDAARADNPFILVGDLDRFTKDRAAIEEYLVGQGAKPGST
ncbi:ankyrin repeat domain-containing protein [Dehalococcoidia bacterium]|nr:ankyrin repeat domain-containing protein [Dehalococcoidia bacterium]